MFSPQRRKVRRGYIIFFFSLSPASEQRDVNKGEKKKSQAFRAGKTRHARIN
jgi:hypothetical protein